MNRIPRKDISRAVVSTLSNMPTPKNKTVPTGLRATYSSTSIPPSKKGFGSDFPKPSYVPSSYMSDARSRVYPSILDKGSNGQSLVSRSIHTKPGQYLQKSKNFLRSTGQVLEKVKGISQSTFNFFKRIDLSKKFVPKFRFLTKREKLIIPLCVILTSTFFIFDTMENSKHYTEDDIDELLEYYQKYNGDDKFKKLDYKKSWNYFKKTSNDYPLIKKDDSNKEEVIFTKKELDNLLIHYDSEQVRELKSVLFLLLGDIPLHMIIEIKLQYNYLIVRNQFYKTLYNFYNLFLTIIAPHVTHVNDYKGQFKNPYKPEISNERVIKTTILNPRARPNNTEKQKKKYTIIGNNGEEIQLKNIRKTGKREPIVHIQKKKETPKNMVPGSDDGGVFDTIKGGFQYVNRNLPGLVNKSVEYVNRNRPGFVFTKPSNKKDEEQKKTSPEGVKKTETVKDTRTTPTPVENKNIREPSSKEKEMTKVKEMKDRIKMLEKKTVENSQKLGNMMTNDLRKMEKRTENSLKKLDRVKRDLESTSNR